VSDFALPSWTNGLREELRVPAATLVAYFPQLKVTSVFRSYTEQGQLYANRHRNNYPVAPPGRSYHNYGRAFDVVAPPNVLRAAGRLWVRWGGTWGGRKDPIHFQA